MKNIRKVWIIVLALCALAALLTVSAWADGMNQTVIGTGKVDVSAPIPAEYQGKTVKSSIWSIESQDALVHLEDKGRDATGTAWATVETRSNVNAAYWIICSYTFINEDETETTIPVEGKIYQTAASVSIDQGALALTVGEQFQLTATTNTGLPVNWDSDNHAAVWVENGYVVGVGEGTATITASSCGAFDSRTINVYPLTPTPTPTPVPTPTPTPVPTPTPTPVPTSKPIITLPETLSVVSGKETSIMATLSGADGHAVIDWTKTGKLYLFPEASFSGFPIKVSAPAGITTAESATITATLRDDPTVTKTCNVIILPNGVKHIDLTSSDYSPKVGETITVTADIKYSTPGDQITAWQFDSNLLQCTEMTGSYAKFKALKAGKSKVTAVSNTEAGKAESFIDIVVGGGSVLNHQITYGNYATFDGTNPLNFITNESIYNFKGVTVDGYALTNGNQYYAQSSSDGHILVTMNPAYLKMLSSSNYHTIQIYSTVNQPATGYFRNYGATQTIYGVKTGDENNIALWVTLGLIGLAGTAAIVITKRKEIFGK